MSDPATHLTPYQPLKAAERLLPIKVQGAATNNSPTPASPRLLLLSSAKSSVPSEFQPALSVFQKTWLHGAADQMPSLVFTM